MVIAPTARLQIDLQLAGLGMPTEVGGSERAIHYLLIPEGLRLADTQGGPPVSPRRAAMLVWDRAQEQPKTPAATANCLWDFVNLDLASPHEFPVKALEFARTWGVWSEIDFVDIETEGPGHIFLQSCWREAAQVHALVKLMVLTENGDVAPESLLENLPPIGPVVLTIYVGPNGKFGGLGESEIDSEREQLIAKWRAEREPYRRLEMQREFVQDLLYYWTPSKREFYWSKEGGRGVERLAFGAWKIIAAHLEGIFLAPQLDVAICSICDKPYQIKLEGGRRRPRSGVRRFCGEACKATGKRMSNLASWHRNRVKWASRARKEAQK